MLQKKRFSDDCASTAKRHVPDRRDNEVSYQDEPIPHVVNNDWGWWRSQDYDSSTAAELQFAMDTLVPLGVAPFFAGIAVVVVLMGIAGILFKRHMPAGRTASIPKRMNSPVRTVFL